MGPVRPAADEDAESAGDRPVQPGRRDFVRGLGREGIRSAGQVVGAVSAISAAPLHVGAELFGLMGPEAAAEAEAAARPGAAGPAAQAPPPTAVDTSPVLRPWRFDGRTLHVLDQRELPNGHRELAMDSAAAVAASLDTLATPFGMALGEIASMGLALAARAASGRTAAERARTLGWNLRLLRAARPSSASVQVALARQEVVVRSLPPDAAGGSVADALADGAAAFSADTAAISRALARVGTDVLARDRAEPIRILTAGTGGPLAGGAGTAGAVIAELARCSVGVRAWVTETRPTLVGARVAALELVQGEIPVSVLADGAVGALLSQVAIDAVLLTAERIDHDGDLLAVAGTYPVAVMAARQGIPVYVVGPSWLADTTESPTGPWDMPSRPAHELSTIGGTRFLPGRSDAFVPLLDRTPADLVTGLISERGLLTR